MKQRLFWILTVLLCCSIGLFAYQEQFANAQDAPPPPESPLPTPSPTPISPEAEIALQFVAARERIAPDQLELAGEETITFPLLEQTYRYITIFHTQPETTQVFSLFVDPVTKS